MSMKITLRPGGTGLCPMCREAISREAKVCPHCRSDLRENPDWKGESSTAGCASLIVFGFMFVGVCAGFAWMA